MIPVHSAWLAAHGKLWYDDRRYRLAWIVWPQALAAVVVLWFWAMPSTGKTAQWAKPLDPAARAHALLALRDAAKSSRPAMDTLERDAFGGETLAQFFFATLFDPDFKLSTIVQPDIVKAVDWYSKAANQGDQSSLNNLALAYSRGIYARVDYTRACYYARKLGAESFGAGLSVKGDCYARGLGGTQVDLVQAASAYETAFNKGNARAEAALGYFYENGLGGRAKSSETALKYYRDAADKGDALGLHNLGAAYNSGLLGLQRDGAEAARLIFRALEMKYEVTLQSLTNRPDIWTSDFWQNLQRRLAEKGLYTGAIDGRTNSATLDAVRRLGKGGTQLNETSRRRPPLLSASKILGTFRAPYELSKAALECEPFGPLRYRGQWRSRLS
jgi:TPR repeat protein